MITTQNAKTIKGESLGYETGILYLAPHKQAGRGNVCSFASKGCAASCLYTAGRGRFDNVKKARLRKTNEFFDNPKNFIEILSGEIAKLVSKTKLLLCIRLNGTSDLPWEQFGGMFGKNLMDRFPQVNFYDYTKNPNRMKAYLRGEFPKNYHLTFSRSECNHDICLDILKMGGNVAMVFDKVPESYAGYEVISGDEHDLRFLDKSNVIVGLKAKGDAKHDESGFVIKGNDEK